MKEISYDGIPVANIIRAYCDCGHEYNNEDKTDPDIRLMTHNQYKYKCPNCGNIEYSYYTYPRSVISVMLK